MRGYIPEGESNGLGCGIALGWFFLSLPFLFLLLFTGGGCEGVSGPCHEKQWPLFAFIGVVLALGASTAWSVKKLRAPRRGLVWWIALAATILLGSFAALLLWILAKF